MTLSCFAAMPLSFSASCAGRHVRGDGGARREAAGVGAGGDRPLVLRRVHLQGHVDVVGLQPQLVGDDLRQHRLVALALHGDVGGHRHRAERIDVDRHHRGRAVLRPGLVARLGRQQASRDSPCSTSRARPRRQSRCRISGRPCAPRRGASSDRRGGRRRSRSRPRADNRRSRRARRPRPGREISPAARDCAGSRRDDRARARPRSAAPAAPAPDKAAARRSRG